MDKYRYEVNFLVICRMRVLLAIAAFVALASAASVSVEDLEFTAWKLKYGECSFQFHSIADTIRQKMDVYIYIYY